MNKFIFFILAGSLFFAVNEVSSQKNTPISKKLFKLEKKPILEELKMPEILYQPSSISFSNDKLLIVDNGSDNYFHLYSYTNLDIIGLYGSKGEGPEEINFIPQLSFFSDKIIQFFNFSRNSIYTIDLNRKDRNNINLTFVLPPDLINPQNVIILDKNTIVGYGVNGGKLFFYNAESDSIKYLTFPNDDKNAPQQSKFIINNGYMCCNPSKDLIVFASLYYDRFFVYNNTSKVILSNVNKDNDNIFYKDGKITTDDTKLYYSSVFATENFFYLLYMGGKSTNEIMEQINNKNFKCEIQQYDWKGNPITTYLIEKPIKDFCIDEKRQHIIAINPLSEDNPIIRFKY